MYASYMLAPGPSKAAMWLLSLSHTIVLITESRNAFRFVQGIRSETIVGYIFQNLRKYHESGFPEGQEAGTHNQVQFQVQCPWRDPFICISLLLHLLSPASRGSHPAFPDPIQPGLQQEAKIDQHLQRPVPNGMRGNLIGSALVRWPR